MTELCDWWWNFQSWLTIYYKLNVASQHLADFRAQCSKKGFVPIRILASPRREASLINSPGSPEPGFFIPKENTVISFSYGWFSISWPGQWQGFETTVIFMASSENIYIIYHSCCDAPRRLPARPAQGNLWGYLPPPATDIKRFDSPRKFTISNALGHLPIKFTCYRLRPPQFRHSFLAGGVAPIQGDVKAAATRHRAWRGFDLGFPWIRAK